MTFLGELKQEHNTMTSH